MALSARDLDMLAQGWDSAIKSLCYPDGTPVEILSMVNPYRPTTHQTDGSE